MLPPPVLFRKFDRGEISREEFQELMKVHQRELIAEMEEYCSNPIWGFLQQLRNRAAAKKLTDQHGAAEVREVLAALGEVEDFPPALLLWNAVHEHMPLHCFIRLRQAPVFRVKKLEITRFTAEITVEYGRKGLRGTTSEALSLERNGHGRMEVVRRQGLA